MDRLAHDLRGPLTPLQTAAYLLRTGQVGPERQDELYAVIERQTRQMARMIDELGDWMRAAQERLIAARESCDPALLLDYARANCGEAGASAKVDNRADGVLVDGDPVRLTQLLRILLAYSASLTTTALEIVLWATDTRLHIEVRAPGAAPPCDLIALLLEQPQTDPHDGGLGLQPLIARAIAEAHGGTLTALVEGGDLVLRCELPVQDHAAMP
ncbi:MAG: HAMP domain-containing sensor histidine kinase [Luteimonas sp.]